MKTGHGSWGPKIGKRMYATVAQNAQGFHFCMKLLIDPVMVGLIELKLVASCDNPPFRRKIRVLVVTNHSALF